MTRLTIDNIDIEVAPGTKVIEAARQAGIVIPHFCYHRALGSVGACRLCAVKVVEGPGPLKGIQMSCMIGAEEGMVVSTTDPEARRMRSLVIEWLMLNHPHDCPVCDEGGECLLQDYTVAGGHGHRRYRGKKRTHVNQYLGPYIEHEMNRCIQCYRCARFYQDFAGGDDLGVLGQANIVYFGRKEAGVLESPFSGNLVDICPTGVFTDKTARFRARYWDYQMAPSICPECSLGCNTYPVGFERELLKIVARRNDQVNGWFICDRGRFSSSRDAVNAPDRPRQPRVEGRDVSWDKALAALTEGFGRTVGKGGEGIALVGSSRMSLEAGVLLARLSVLLPGADLCYFLDDEAEKAAIMAVSLLEGRLAWSMADVAQADCIAVVNCDLLAEGPMMALAVRQAWRRGATVYLVGEAPEAGLAAVSVPWTRVAALGEIDFARCQKPVVVCGTATPDISAIKGCADQAAGVTYLFTGPNGFAAALLAREYEAASLSRAIGGGARAIVAVEADIAADALPEGVELLALADWQGGPAAARAKIVLPTAATCEMDGTYINHEGRAQRFRRIMRPGTPVRAITDALGHPPRVFRPAAPGGDLRPAWQILATLIERLGGDAVTESLTGRWQGIAGLDAEGPGLKPGGW